MIEIDVKNIFSHHRLFLTRKNLEKQQKRAQKFSVTARKIFRDSTPDFFGVATAKFGLRSFGPRYVTETRLHDVFRE